MINKSKKIDIWLCELTHTRQTIASETVPLACGLIASYCDNQDKNIFNFEIIKNPDELTSKILKKQPRVLAFSNYFWNLDLSYAMAEEIKKRFPEIVVVFGGPNFPLDNEEKKIFLKKYSSIDFYIKGEGELSFYKLLTKLMEKKFNINETKSDKNENCCYLIEDKFIEHEVLPRININDSPSPYLEGRFDKYLKEGFMPIIQTCRGCPFTCSYCCEGQPYYSLISFRNPKEVYKELEYIAKRCSQNQKLNIADSNFGQYPQDIKTAESIAKVQKKYDYPHYIIVATGKNNKDNVVKVAKIVKGAIRLSASVQSTDPEVLENVRRTNVSVETLIKLAQEANKTGSNTYSEIILGLPGDTKEKHLKSLETMINTNLNYARPYTLMTFYGSEISTKETKEKHGLVMKYRVLPRCFGTYEIGGKKINSVEIEEVCVAGKNLSFDDYLYCRLFHLTIEVFYNDRIFYELFAFIKKYDIKPYDLLFSIHNDQKYFPKVLNELFKSFYNEVKDELWDNKEDLEKFSKKEAVIKKYVNGEYGSNLTFKYKAIIYSQYVKELHVVAYDVAEKMLKNKKVDDKQVLDFLNEMKLFSLYQKNQMFDVDKSFNRRFNFDMKKALDKKFEVNPKDIVLRKPKEIFFEFSKDQKLMIENSLNQFGNSIIGLGRVLSRVHITKLHRKIKFQDG